MSYNSWGDFFAAQAVSFLSRLLRNEYIQKSLSIEYLCYSDNAIYLTSNSPLDLCQRDGFQQKEHIVPVSKSEGGSSHTYRRSTRIQSDSSGGALARRTTMSHERQIARLSWRFKISVYVIICHGGPFELLLSTTFWDDFPQDFDF